MRLRLHWSLCALVLPLSLKAQVDPRIDPPLFEWFSTSTETGFPFGYAGRRVVHMLEVHDSMQGHARTIRAIAIRRAPAQTVMVPAFDATVSLHLSTAVTTAATMSANFALNEGPDRSTVIQAQRISFPTTQGPFTAPAPFEYPIPLQTPFAFAGQGPLCVDLEVQSHSNTVETRFALFAADTSHLATFGTACGALWLQTQMTATMAIHTVHGAPAGAPVLLLCGFNFESLFGQPLPLDLSSIGAPGCALELQPVIDVQGFADPSGSITFRVPLQSARPGDYYACQAATIQPGLNALGIELSAADLTQPITPRVAGRVWNENLTATSGVLQPVYGLVLEVR